MIRRALYLVVVAGLFGLFVPAAHAGVCPTQSNDADAQIADGTQSGGPGQTIVTTFFSEVTDVDVNLKIVHPNVGQLAVYLQHQTNPITVPIELTSGNGGGGENYTGTILDDEANDPITGAPAPFNGRWQPETPLSFFDGHSGGGAWTLSVYDGVDGETGYLDSWGLTVSSDECGAPSDCEEAQADLEKAKKKLRKLKQRDASKKKIRKAKKAVKEAEAAVEKACGPQ